MPLRMVAYSGVLPVDLRRLFQRNRGPLLVSIGLYAIGMATGLVIVSLHEVDFTYFASTETPQTFDQPITVAHLVWNNVLVLLTLLSGTFLLGVSTILNLLINGFVFGSVWGSMDMVPLSRRILLVLPHGVFELTGYWLAGAAGLKIPTELIGYLRNRSEHLFNRRAVIDIASLGGLAFALILIGAVIEARVTMALVEAFS